MWTRVDMTAVGELVLVLGLLVSAHCEVRARDPEVEEEEEERGGRAAAGAGGAAFSPHLESLHPGVTGTPPQADRGNHPARTGNWCAFVQTRVVTVAVACGTEKYTIKSQSPCPSGTADCQMVMYKLSTRPVYRQKQQTYTSLLWHCCLGHGGHNCEETVSDTQLDSGRLALIGGSETARAALQAAAVQQQRVDVNREQNDHQTSVGELYDPGRQHNTTPPPLDPDHGHSPHHTSHHTAKAYDHAHRQQGHHHHDKLDATDLSHPEAPTALPAPDMMALVMSQLQPVLEGFNRSLEHLSRQVGELARDVSQLKSRQPGPEPQTGPLDGPELDEAAEERLDAKLDEHMREVQRHMESQRTDVENRLHSQHAMLHYNLTIFKTDIDMKLKRHQKMLQVSLQAMNATLADLKLDQDQIPEVQLRSPGPLQPAGASALWEAIERLDNMVVNNTVKVDGLMEDVDVTSGTLQRLGWDFKELVKQINQTARDSRVLFMETGLEVEAAKEAVLRRVNELAGNLSQQGERLQEMDVDVDYLYTVFYGQNSSADCDCKGLKAAVAHLERGVANVTELANENRLALDDNSEGGAGQWGGATDWEPAVGALQQGLQEVKESLASEQTRTRTLEHSLTQLSGSLKVCLAEVSFTSLLKDAIRHSDVLELLLGEEVLEFLEWPVQDQEAHSIPALKEQLGQLLEQLRRHDLSITSLLGDRPGGSEEVPSADQPSSSHLLPDDWLPGSMRRSSEGVPARERQLLLHPEGRRPEHRGDGSDLWNLEKTVEQLGLKVLRLEEKSSNTSTPPGGVVTKLQTEVMWLKRGLEEHLRVFKNVFSNADVLAGADATLELDKLWQLVRSRDGKKEKKRGGAKEGSGRGGTHRSRRDSSGVAPVPSSLSEDSLLLVAGSPLSVSDGIVMFEASLNRGRFYSDTGTFTAPVNGIYLFVLTLDLRPGPAHVVLRRGSGVAPVSLQRQEVPEAGPATGVGLLPLSEGEEVRLELKGGTWVESEDNVFTVLLLHPTT
ncbi:multimerin-2a isoform X2 [Chelmon rostratus]|uniref:multimerin-2a isoform X2 n=1 Tax=Chelmon rostratus TaxID=109905 RepID=UPI001BEADF94|nr:multimerin-2a isoform X2 [Chelmon rostratus]